MKWAIWIPWSKSFVLKSDQSGLMLFDDEAECRGWVRQTNACMRACDHEPQKWPRTCRQCAYRAVPWDKQAQDIANGIIQP